MKDNLSRTLYTLFLAAVGIAAAIVADRLFGQYIMITALLTVLYFVGLAVQYWAYELAYFHNYIHNAFHSRGAATDEPSDFAVGANKLSGYVITLLSIVFIFIISV